MFEPGGASPTAEAEVHDAFGDTSGEVRRVELDAVIGRLAAQVHSMEAHLVDALAELVSLGGASGLGYRSVAHWLSIRTKYTMRDAHELALLASRHDMIEPLLEDARAGQLSVGVLAPAAAVAHSANTEALRDTLRMCAPSQALRTLRTYRRVAHPETNTDRGGGGDNAQVRPEFVEPGPSDGLPVGTWWHHWTDNHGRYRLDAALDPATGALLETARDAARLAAERAATERAGNPNPDGDETAEQRHPRPSVTEVIGGLATAAIEGIETHGVRSTGGERFRIHVTCDLQTLAAALGIDLDSKLPIRFGSRAYLPNTGAHLSDTELSELLCEGTTQLLVDHDGEPLWLGHDQRLFTPAQRRVLLERADHRCEFPGCGNTRWLHAHHLDEHCRGGTTDPPNGAIVCPRHHHELHRHKWKLLRHHGGRLEWFDQRGKPLAVTQLPNIEEPPTPLPGIGPDTPTSTGGGEPLTNFGLDVLLQHLLAA